MYPSVKCSNPNPAATRVLNLKASSVWPAPLNPTPPNEPLLSEFWQTIVTTADEITQIVGAQLLQDFGQAQAIEKTDGSLVTQSDQWADREICQRLTAAFPTHGVLSEEGDHQFPDKDWCWVIDPLDGTTNFTNGIPIWAISLGLLYQGTPVFGWVTLPTLGYRFHGFWQAPEMAGQAAPANQAWLNHQPIHTSPNPLGSNQFFSLCARSTAVLKQPFPAKIRMLGSSSYNFLTVAAGATIGGVEATPKIWDIAAVYPIVLAAGGTWQRLHPQPPFPLVVGGDYSATPYPTLVTSQTSVLETLLPLMASITQK
jgi:myo-inositol-1(or 4)-monophosphatase